MFLLCSCFNIFAICWFIEIKPINCMKNGIKFNNMSLNPLSRNYLFDITCKVSTQPKKQNTPAVSKHSAKASVSAKQTKASEPINESTSTSNLKVIQVSFPIEGYKASHNMVYTNEGFMFAFLRNDKKISGRACVLFPEGIIVNCQVINGSLTGWAAICKKDVFYCLTHFQKGKFDGAQFTLDVGCGLMMKSVYKAGKLRSIKQGAAEGTSSFQKLVQNKELINLLDETVDNGYFQKNYPKLTSSLGTFYGELSYEIPSGVGVLLTDTEMFYGEFYRGLLDGQGTMSFENGDCYVGDVKEGMMRGTGHYTKRGISTYRYYEAELTPRQFKEIRKFASLDEIPELENIFHPLVSFYRKLQEIYQHRRGNISSRKDSFVQIALDNENEEEQANGSQDMDRMSSKSSNSLRESKKEDMMNELMRTNTGRANDNAEREKFKDRQLEKERYKEKEKEQDKKKEVVKLKPQLKKAPTQGEDLIETAELQVPKPKGKQKKANSGAGRGGALNDYEWEQIMEQLEQESVTKQDGFLKPKEEGKENDHDTSLKKNPLNSRINPKSVISSDFKSEQEKDRLQNRIIGTLSKKK